MKKRKLSAPHCLINVIIDLTVLYLYLLLSSGTSATNPLTCQERLQSDHVSFSQPFVVEETQRAYHRALQMVLSIFTDEAIGDLLESINSGQGLMCLGQEDVFCVYHMHKTCCML